MNNLIVQKVNTFKGLLNESQFQAQIKNSMKENAGAFMSSLLDLYSTDSSLQKCEPRAVMIEALKACALKLPLTKSLGFAYVVPFKGKPTFMIGYKGLIQLAQRTGAYKYINSGMVYEGEMINEGENKLSGVIDITGERTSDIIVGYFAYIELLNGFKKSLYMTKDECIAWKKYSASASSSFSPWKNEFDKMAKKTVLRQLISVYGVMSTEMINMVSEDKKHDEKQEDNKPIDVYSHEESLKLDEEIIEQEGEQIVDQG